MEPRPFDRDGSIPVICRLLGRMGGKRKIMQKPPAVWIGRGLTVCNLDFYPFRLRGERWLIPSAQSIIPIIVNRLHTLIPTRFLAIGGGLMC